MRKLEAERRKSGGGRGGGEANRRGGISTDEDTVQIQIERWFSDKCRIINLSLTYSYT